MKLHRSQCETPLPLPECPSSVSGTETLGTFRVRPSCLGSLFLLVLVCVPQKHPVGVLSLYFVTVSALLEWASLVRTLERINHAQRAKSKIQLPVCILPPAEWSLVLSWTTHICP